MRFVAILVIALTIVPWHAEAQQEQPALQQPRNQPNQQQPAPENRGTEKVPFIVKQLPHERSNTERQEAREKTELDRKLTNYTNELAFYTKCLFGATLFLAALTGILAVFTGVLARAAHQQMTEGRRAIKATEELAKAAVEHARHAESAIAVSKDTAERQLRAYVLVGQATVLDPDSPNPRIDIRFRNFGRTPAYDVVIPATAGAFNPQDARTFPPPAIDAASSRSILGPNSDASKVIPLDKILAGPHAMAMLRARTEHILYVWGEIHYRDIFKKTRHAKFRLSIGGPLGWPESNLMIVAPEGNDEE